MFTRVKTTLCALVAICFLGLAGNFAPLRAEVLTKATTTAPIRFNTQRYLEDRAILERDSAIFPNLRGDYEVLKPGVGNYNCIAWSLGITNQWVWPGQTVADFDNLNAKFGYHRLKTLDLRVMRGWDKIVLYGLVKGGKWEATHQARQHIDGTWTSKLGKLALIRHRTPDALNGPSYGQVAYVYVRQSRDTQTQGGSSHWPVAPASAPKTPAPSQVLVDTTWIGTENTQKVGIGFRFLGNGQVKAISSDQCFLGTYTIQNGTVTMTFRSMLVYTGNINGNTISGQARVIAGPNAGMNWSFLVRR